MSNDPQTTDAELRLEIEQLHRQLAWCIPRMSKDCHRDRLRTFFAERGISLPLPGRDEPRMVQSLTDNLNTAVLRGENVMVMRPDAHGRMWPVWVWSPFEVAPVVRTISHPSDKP